MQQTESNSGVKKKTAYQEQIIKKIDSNVLIAKALCRSEGNNFVKCVEIVKEFVDRMHLIGYGAFRFG